MNLVSKMGKQCRISQKSKIESTQTLCTDHRYLRFMLFSDQNAKNKNCIRFDGCIARDKTGCLKLAGFVLLRGGVFCFFVFFLRNSDSIHSICQGCQTPNCQTVSLN